MELLILGGGLLSLVLQLVLDYRQRKTPEVLREEAIKKEDHAIDTEFQADDRMATATRLRELHDQAERRRARGQ